MNRGLARRSVFEDRPCVRFFLSCLARTGLRPSALRRAYDAHREWVEEEARYGAMVGRIGAACVGD